MEFKRFGVMLDCSRNAVMRVEQLKKFIDCLAKIGYNALELYTEDTYEVEGEPYFGYMRGRYTGAEIREIDAYAKSQGIELIPCIQTLAHLDAIFRHEEYASVRDMDNILLIDEPKTYELIEKMFATLAKNFTSRLVNIGMDEAHMVGLGKYLDKHGYSNRFALLAKHLNKVLEIAEKYGFKAHMWSDMFFRLISDGYYVTQENFVMPKEVVDLIPDGVDLVFWDYYHTVKRDYDCNFFAHKSIGKPCWFAGGAWSWNGFAPLNWFSHATMKPAMESAREQGVENVLITMWGDDGAECSYFSLLPALYAIRQYAEGRFDEKEIEKGFYECFGVDYQEFSLLDLPNDPENTFLQDGNLFYQNPSKVLLYSDPFMGVKDDLYVKGKPIDYQKYAQTLRKTAGKMKEFEYLFRAAFRLCDLLAVKADLGIKTRNAYKAGDKAELERLVGEYARAVQKTKAFHKAFFEVWDTENKPFGWELQDARLGGLCQRLKTCKDRLQAYISGKVDKIDELEETLLPMEENCYLQLNLYAKTISWSKY